MPEKFALSALHSLESGYRSLRATHAKKCSAECAL